MTNYQQVKKNHLKMVIKKMPVAISKSTCLTCWKTQSLLQLHRPISQGELVFSNTQCLQQEARAPVLPAGLSRSHPLLSPYFPQNLSPVQNFPWQKWPGSKREHFGWRVCHSGEVFVCQAPGTWIEKYPLHQRQRSCPKHWIIPTGCYRNAC